MIHPLDGSQTPEDEDRAERAAIVEYDGQIPRAEAERLAREWSQVPDWHHPLFDRVKETA